MSDKKPDAVWQGRLSAGLDPRARALNDSLPVDSRLVPEELALSRAYAATLAECGVMSEAECAALVAACDALEADLGAGLSTLAGEDVHSAVESALAQRCGDPALRLHTGRSRNDQVATLLRMHVMRLCDTAVEGVRELERALVTQARDAGDLACASYTHLQPAQPVRLAHWWLAHVEALSRDEERFAEARESASSSGTSRESTGSESFNARARGSRPAESRPCHTATGFFSVTARCLRPALPSSARCRDAPRWRAAGRRAG